MPFVDFLSADTALVKTFTLNNGVIEKSPYPMVRDFTSHRRDVADLSSFFKALVEAADQGWCMSKGPLTKEITNESRAGLTDATQGTHILILDFDGLTGFDSIDDAITHAGLADYSHVIQWSASAWLTSQKTQTTFKTPSLTNAVMPPSVNTPLQPSLPSPTHISPLPTSQQPEQSSNATGKPTAAQSGTALSLSSEKSEPLTSNVGATTASKSVLKRLAVQKGSPSVSTSEPKPQATQTTEQSASAKASTTGTGATGEVISTTKVQSQPLSAHVFFWIDNPVTPSLVKSWLMRLNMRGTFATSIRLTRTGAALHWPIDPSVADNSKLIYIAPPVLRGGLQPPSPAPTITYVKRELDALHSTLFTINPQEVVQEKQKLLSRLREEAGLPKLKDSQFKNINGQLYLSKPGEATITGIKHERGFVYLNLNGGDSWGYYHPEDNSEFIYNFKGEPIYKTAELLPEYQTSLNKVERSASAGSVKYFVCRDFRTDRLYNGIYYADEDRLDMARAANEGRLKSFLKQHGQPVQDFVPDFSITYDPHDKRKFDLEERYINTYVPSRFESVPRREQKTVPPMVRRVIESAVGKGDNYEHFLNWLADIVQFKEKIGTAWVLHGNEGTGKGVLFHRIVTPVLGNDNVASITMRTLDSTFNGFMERALCVFVDEVQIPALKGSLGISATLRNFITEKVISVRRMYSEPYNAKNYANFIFASNMPDPVIVPPTDRRFHVGEFQPSKLVLSDAELGVLDAQVEDFYMYLAGRTVDRTRTKEIINSEDRERLIKLSQTAADAMAEVILKGDIEDLVVNMPQNAMLPSEAAYVALVKRLLEQGDSVKKLSRDELLTIFQYRVGKEVPDSPNKFTSFLKHHRIYMKRVRISERIVYGIDVNWNKDSKWMAETLASFGPQPSAPNNVTPIQKAKLPAA